MVGENASASVPGETAAELYSRVRQFTERLVAPLEPGDMEPQSMADCSPTKWHLAHTTWFFETFVLAPYEPGFREFHPKFRYLFNSYYNAVGERQLRPERGLLTRPTLQVVQAYRESVDERVISLLARLDARQRAEVESLVELGCHHEQQHQELIVTDIKHLFSKNVLRPSYATSRRPSGQAPMMGFSEFEPGLYEVGHAADSFSFDNECPKHRVFLEAFMLATRLVTNREYAEFIADGGYARPDLWLDMGFAAAQSSGWDKPLYWSGDPGSYTEFTMSGERELNLDEPVCHLSLYEADAFARWAGARLPREHEWEVAAQLLGHAGSFAEDGISETGALHPSVAAAGSGLQQCFGDCWEWTQSAYSPYPGYRAPEGALGEYNGKFMVNQLVLRGGSCATARSHIRATYRNFFYAKDRWQFSGLRLAKDS